SDLSSPPPSSSDPAPPAYPAPSHEIPSIPEHTGSVEAEIQPVAPPVTVGAFSYRDWIREQEPDDEGLTFQRNLAAAFSCRPKISIVVPVYRTPFEIVDQMIASVIGQTYRNWELCLAHADPAATRTRQYIAALAASDARVKFI